MSQTVKPTRNYKATFILDSRGYDEPVESLYEMLTEGIRSSGADVSEVESLGRVDFVRVTDRDHPGDYYLVFHFSGSPSAPAQIQETFRLERKVKRILIEQHD